MNSPAQDSPLLPSSPWVLTTESSSSACIPTTINSTSSAPSSVVDTLTSPITRLLGNQEKPLTPSTSTMKQSWSQLITKTLSSGPTSIMKDFHLLPIPLDINPDPQPPLTSSSPLVLLVGAAATRQPMKRKTFHFTSPTPTPSLPSKKQKATISLNNIPTPDSSPQITSSISLKMKREQCIKDMV